MKWSILALAIAILVIWAIKSTETYKLDAPPTEDDPEWLEPLREWYRNRK